MNSIDSEELKQTIVQISDKGVEEVLDIWFELYGPTGVNSERVSKFVDEIKAFWECQIECQNERKKNIATSIEQAGKEAFRLEKALGLKPEVEHLTSGKDVPLVTLEEQVWKMLSSYQEVSDKRLEEYSDLQKKEDALCSALDIKIRMRNDFISSRKGVGSKRKGSFIPTSDNIAAYKKWIFDLERQKEQLKDEFETNKKKLELLLEQCEVTPNETVEQFVSGEEEFTVSRKNLNLLKSTVQKYKKIQEEMIAEADHLRNEVVSLGKKLSLDVDEFACFLKENSGHSQTAMENLKEKLKQLKEERKLKIKDLIISRRKNLDELWKKCFYSEEEKAEFKPYDATHWSEEVLDLHELEIENLENFYGQNKRLIQLTEKYDGLWTRLLHLEEVASNKDRLFNNRGGCLLKEEKERKLIQNKVPTIRRELMRLLSKYREDTGKDFMHFGMPLQREIEMKDEKREISKENAKLMRKVINEKNLFLESRLGVKQSTGGKGRFLTPQHRNNYSKLIKTNAHSTPRLSRSASCLSGLGISERPRTRVIIEKEANDDAWLEKKPQPTNLGRMARCDTPRPPLKTPSVSTFHRSLSYESFKENMIKSTSKASHEKCTKPAYVKVLRPKDENKPRGLSDNKLLRTKNTPIEKPILRSTTVSKIPRAATPTAARSAAKVTRARRKLPIIL